MMIILVVVISLLSHSLIVKFDHQQQRVDNKDIIYLLLFVIKLTTSIIADISFSCGRIELCCLTVAGT